MDESPAFDRRPPTWPGFARGLGSRIATPSPTIVAALFFLDLHLFAGRWGWTMWHVTCRWAVAMLGVLIAVWWTGRRSERGTWYASPLDWILVPTLAALLFSFLANPHRLAEAAIGWWSLLASFLLFSIVHDLLMNRRLSLAELTDGFLWGSSLPVAYGIAESLITGARAAGTMEHANNFGVIAGMMVPLAFQRLRERAPDRRYVYAAGMVLGLAGLYLSGSRGALLGLFAAALVLAPVWVRLTALVVGGPLLLATLFVRWESVIARGEVFQYAWDQFTQRPWGGHGLFTFRYEQFGAVHLHAHNALLQIAYEIGLPGLLVFLAAAVTVAWAARRCGSSQRGWRAVLAGSAVHHLVDFVWMYPGTAATLSIALAAVLFRADQAPRVHQRLSNRFFAGIAILVLGIGLSVGNIPAAFLSERALQDIVFFPRAP